MTLELLLSWEFSAAQLAPQLALVDLRPDALVDGIDVCLDVVLARKSLITNLARIISLAGVCLGGGMVCEFLKGYFWVNF
jgi:hypothetical protein